jgi:hypothetical protein
MGTRSRTRARATHRTGGRLMRRGVAAGDINGVAA